MRSRSRSSRSAPAVIRWISTPQLKIAMPRHSRHAFAHGRQRVLRKVHQNRTRLWHDVFTQACRAGGYTQGEIESQPRLRTWACHRSRRPTGHPTVPPQASRRPTARHKIWEIARIGSFGRCFRVIQWRPDGGRIANRRLYSRHGEWVVRILAIACSPAGSELSGSDHGSALSAQTVFGFQMICGLAAQLTRWRTDKSCLRSARPSGRPTTVGLARAGWESADGARRVSRPLIRARFDPIPTVGRSVPDRSRGLPCRRGSCGCSHQLAASNKTT